MPDDDRDDDLHDRIDRLALKIERTIKRWEDEDYPEFEPRSKRSRQLEQAYPEVTDEPRN